MTTPLISVVLPVYNGERYISDSVESILRQTYAEFELIVVNDGSSDQTAEKLDCYKDTRIVRITNQLNRGLIWSLNTGIEAASGDYIARMDADDISYPDRFAQQIAFLTQHPDVGVLGGQVEFYDETCKYKVYEHTYLASHGLIAWQMMFANSIPHPTVMFRKSLVNGTPAYDSEHYAVEDFELWTRLVFQTRLANLPVPVLAYRRHENTVSHKNNSVQRENANKVRQKYIEKVIGYPVGDDVPNLFDKALVHCEDLTQPEARRLMELSLSFYLAALERGWFMPEEQTAARDALFETIDAIRTSPTKIRVEPTREDVRKYLMSVSPKSLVRLFYWLRRNRLLPGALLKKWY